MTAGRPREWATVEEHVNSTLHQEETMSSPVHAALSVVLDQAAVLTRPGPMTS